MAQEVRFDARFVTWIDAVDDQHRNLASLANEVGNTFSHAPPPDRVREVVQELSSYAIYHFKAEERLMQEHGYTEGDPDSAAQHVQMHRDFSAKVMGIQEMLDEGHQVDTMALVRFLNDWIGHHILETDQRFAAFVAGRRGPG